MIWAVASTVIAVAIVLLAARLGGADAAASLRDRIRRKQPAPLPDQSLGADPAHRATWVDDAYLRTSGVIVDQEARGYEVQWCAASHLAQRIESEGWEYARRADGRILRMRNRPEDQTLIRRQLPFRVRLVARASGNPPRDVVEITANGRGRELREILTITWGGEPQQRGPLHQAVGSSITAYFTAGRRGTTCVLALADGTRLDVKIHGA